MEPSSQEFADIVREHQSAVCAAAYGVTGDRALSEDIAQDTFVAAWRGLPALRDPAKLRGWLRGIAKNLARKATRKAAPTQELDERLAARTEDSSGEEQERVTWAAVRALPEKYREALVLYYWESCSAKQVAAVLGISEVAAMQRLSRGRALLRDEIQRTIEGTLARRRPGAMLTVAILAAVAASASGTSTAGTSAANARVPRAGTRASKLAWTTALVALLAVLVTTVVLSVSFGSNTTTVGASTAPASPAAARTTPASGPRSRSTSPTAVPHATAHDDQRTGSGDELDPDGRFVNIRVTAVDHPDGWLTPELQHALSPCFYEEMIKHPARIAVTARDGKIASVSLEPLDHPDMRVVVSMITDHAIVGAIARDELAAHLAAGKPIATSPDDPRFVEHAKSMTLAEFVGQCTQAKLVGRRVPGPDATHRLQIAGEEVTPKKIDREAFTDLDVANGAARGPRDARVTIVTFLDIADPPGFGGKIIAALEQVLATYPKDVRVVVKMCPFPVPGHDLAAEAAYAANAQGALWPMLQRIASARDHLALEDLVAHATALHLDVARFRSELEAHTYRDAIELDQDQMTTMDIRSLPSSIINGKRVHGALQLNDYMDAVENALGSAVAPSR
jgi:RNA polymerase sigma factor (sigma-70 family)